MSHFCSPLHPACEAAGSQEESVPLALPHKWHLFMLEKLPTAMQKIPQLSINMDTSKTFSVALICCLGRNPSRTPGRHNKIEKLTERKRERQREDGGNGARERDLNCLPVSFPVTYVKLVILSHESGSHLPCGFLS